MRDNFKANKDQVKDEMKAKREQMKSDMKAKRDALKAERQEMKKAAKAKKANAKKNAKEATESMAPSSHLANQYRSTTLGVLQSSTRPPATVLPEAVIR